MFRGKNKTYYYYLKLKSQLSKLQTISREYRKETGVKTNFNLETVVLQLVRFPRVVTGSIYIDLSF